MVLAFAEGFSSLLSRYRGVVEKDVEGWSINKKKLENDPNFNGAFEMIIQIIVSRGWRRMGKLGKFEREVKKSDWNRTFFESPKGIELLKRYRVERNVQRLLLQLEGRTLRDWTEGRYRHAKNHEEDRLLKEIGFGPKSRDVYLRAMGYTDRAPIDIHERRFLVRTGIFHSYSKVPSDPLEYDDLQDALANFCKECLSGLKVKGLDLGESPGIVDAIIWHHCARFEGEVCGKSPICFFKPDKCPLFRKACLWSMTNEMWKKDTFFRSILQNINDLNQSDLH